MSFALLDDVGRAPDRVVGGDVELDEAGTEAVGGRAAPLGVTGADVDNVPGLEQTPRRLVPETLVRARDERDRHRLIVRPAAVSNQATCDRGTVSARHGRPWQPHTGCHGSVGVDAWRRPASLARSGLAGCRRHSERHETTGPRVAA